MKKISLYNRLKVAFVICLAVVLMLPVYVVATASSADQLIALGMPYPVANFIGTKMISVNTSGNLVLPVATGKKLSVTVGGTEKASVTSGGVLTATGITNTGTIVSTGQATQTGLVFPTANEEVVAGAGTTVADAGALAATKHIHQLTGANGTVGWAFAASTAGQFEFLLNTTAGVPKIYANTGGTCNGGSANAACTLVTGIVGHLCYSTAVDTWVCS